RVGGRGRRGRGAAGAGDERERTADRGRDAMDSMRYLTGILCSHENHFVRAVFADMDISAQMWPLTMKYSAGFTTA
ncbi:MAG TPA: hypothetical protein VHW23_19130, partial [Kofleriaceae bacterium]|nr:hypothetical protein [Kofleriaceae bacterium]